MDRISCATTVRYVPDNRTEAFQLLPSATVIRRAKDGNVSPEKVSVAVYRVLGSERERITDLSAIDGNLEVGLYDSDGNALEGGGIAPESLVEITTDTEKISFELKVGGEIVALLDIPVIADGIDGEPGKDGQPGADGENGKDAVVYTLIATPTYVNANPKGYALQDQTVSCSAIKTIGDTTETLDVAQYLFFWEELGSGTRRYTRCNLGDSISVSIKTVRCGFAMYDGQRENNATLLAETEVLYVRMAEPGEPGAKGAIIRVTEWAEGFNYCDGSEPSADGYTYIDIVTMQVGYGRQTRHVCIFPHKSSAENKPVADTETKWWKPMDSTNPIYTPLILADNAKIAFVGSQEIAIYDNSDKLTARLGAPNRTVCKTLSDKGLSGFYDLSIMEAGGDMDYPQRVSYSLGENGLTRYGSEMENYITINPATRSMDVWQGRNSGGSITPIVSFRATPLDASEIAEINTAVLDNLNVFKGKEEVICQNMAAYEPSKEGTIELATFTTKQTTDLHLTTAIYLANNNCNYVEATLKVVGTGGTYHGESYPDLRLESTGTEPKQVAGIKITDLPPGDWTFLVEVRISRNPTGSMTTYPNGMTGNAYEGSGRVTAYRDETYVYNTSEQTKEFRARYATNGLLIANSHNDRLLVHDTADGMEFKFQNRNNHGIKIDKNGVFVTDSNGVWRSLSQLLSK